MTATDQLRASAGCTFCQKPAASVSTLVAGAGVYICNECVDLCVEIIKAKPASSSGQVSWEHGLDDDALLAHLPRVAAISAQVDKQLAWWVGKARDRGITWARIGVALGMTRQSAWERFSGEE